MAQYRIDTLSSIASRVLGNTARHIDLQDAKNIRDWAEAQIELDVHRPHIN